MITDVVFRSLRSRSRLIPVEELLNGCAGGRMPEVIPDLLTAQIAITAATVCPTGAIKTQTRDPDSVAVRLDDGGCIGSGRCVDGRDGAIPLVTSLSETWLAR